ncbi:MAG: hypothetical protein J0647_10950 [Campylobacteraceae bacterium]|nr:hypothetical protein [Campylobacteraceae bacterium]
MEITLNGIRETLKLQGTSLFIGNEYDKTISDIYIEDITSLTDGTLSQRVNELSLMLTEALCELKQMAIKAFDKEPMLEGSIG